MISAQIAKNKIQKIKHTQPQSTLNKVERTENVKGVYKVKNIDEIKNKKIWKIIKEKEKNENIIWRF